MAATESSPFLRTTLTSLSQWVSVESQLKINVSLFVHKGIFKTSLLILSH